MVIIIKLLNVILDGNKIYATVSLVFHVLVLIHSCFIFPKILNTVINSTGSVDPVKTPIAKSQATAMLRNTKINTTDIYASCIQRNWLFANGGRFCKVSFDPVEVNWVGTHFKRDTKLLVGSVFE